MNIFDHTFYYTVFYNYTFFRLTFKNYICTAFGSFTKTAGLTLVHWCITIAVGAVSVPLGVLMRFIPVTEDENTFRGYTFVKKEATEEDSKA